MKQIKNQKTNIAAIPKCVRCGNTLEVNEQGVPVTSLWKDGKWFCNSCMKKKEN